MTFVLWAIAVIGATLVGWVSLALARDVNASLGGALPPAAVGTALLVVAAVRERQDRRTLHLRHCLECGATVAPSAAACARCGSVRLEAISDHGSGGRLGRRAPETREMPVAAFSADRSGIIGWVDGAPPGAEGFGGDAGTGTKRLRVWGIVLWAAAGLFLAFGLLSPS